MDSYVPAVHITHLQARGTASPRPGGGGSQSSTPARGQSPSQSNRTASGYAQGGHGTQHTSPFSTELQDLLHWILSPNLLTRCTWEQLAAHPYWTSANQSSRMLQSQTAHHTSGGGGNLDIKPLNISNSDFPPQPLYDSYYKYVYEYISI